MLLGLGKQIGLPGVQVNGEGNMFMNNQPFAAANALPRNCKQTIVMTNGMSNAERRNGVFRMVDSP